jgi:molybdenum cofactor synthesis domain-containing protein
MTSQLITAAVLTVSDRCSRGEMTDTCGPALCQWLRRQLSAQVAATACVPDEVSEIRRYLQDWSVDPAPDLIVTAGGTGLAPRDVTPEATRPLLEREHPGLIQLMQMRCYAITPRTFLSRGVAGTLNHTLIINLPGSRKAATECIEALLDILPHAIATLRGEVKDHGQAVR